MCFMTGFFPFLTMYIGDPFMSVYIDLPLRLDIPLYVGANRPFLIFYLHEQHYSEFHVHTYLCSCVNYPLGSGIDESKGIRI